MCGQSRVVLHVNHALTYVTHPTSAISDAMTASNVCTTTYGCFSGKKSNSTTVHIAVHMMNDFNSCIQAALWVFHGNKCYVRST